PRPPGAVPARRAHRRPPRGAHRHHRPRPHVVPGRLTVLSLTFHEMRAHARRLTGTGLAVLLGVAFLTGTLVLGATLRANFDDLFTEVNRSEQHTSELQ